MKPRLVSAILENSCKDVKKALQDGHKLEMSDFNQAFYEAPILIGGRNSRTVNLDPQILALLDEYKALPKEVSISNLRFLLFLMGNRAILPNDFLNKSDLTFERCAGLVSPMEYSANHGEEETVRNLITAGIKERPIFTADIYVHESYFQGLDFQRMKVDEFKQVINENFTGRCNEVCQGRSLENVARVIEILLTNPTDELSAAIEKEAKSCASEKDLEGIFRFLPFFAWAAKNNKAHLFDNEYFVKLFVMYSGSAAESIRIAAVFDSKEFLKKAIIVHVKKEKVCREAIAIAAVTSNQALIVTVRDLLGELNLSFSNICHKSTMRGDPIIGSGMGIDEPLYWAIVSNNNNAVAYFLEHKMDPNDYKDAFTGNSLLHIAVCLNINIVELLLNHGANVACTNYSQETPLHIAKKENCLDIADLLIRHAKKAPTFFHKLIKGGFSFLQRQNNGMTPLEETKDVSHRVINPCTIL